jgi:hypothetical protein
MVADMPNVSGISAAVQLQKIADGFWSVPV